MSSQPLFRPGLSFLSALLCALSFIDARLVDRPVGGAVGQGGMGGRRPAASFLTSSSRHSGSVSGEREEDWQGFEGGTEFVDEFLGLVQNREDGFFEALSRHSPLISADCPRGLNVGIRVFEDGTARCMDSVPHTEGGSCVMDQDCDQEGFLTCSRNAGGEEGEERRCVCPETSLGSISGGSCVLSDVLKKKLQECERHCNTSDGSRCVRAFHPSHPPASPSSSDRDRFVCQKPSASEKFLSGCRRCSATQMARSGFCADREHSGKVQEGEPSCECPKQNLPSEATTLFWKPGGTGCVERGAAFGLFREKCAPTVEGERERERRGAAEQEEEEELERDPRLVCNAGKGLVCADTGVCKCDPSQHLQPEWDPSFQVCTDRIPAGMSGQCLHDRDCDLLQGLNCDSATLTCLKPSEEEGSTDQAPVCSPPCETKDEVCARGRNARRGRVSASTGVCIPWGESKRQCAKCWGPDLRPSDGVSCVEVEGRWECVCKGVGARWNAASRVCEGPSHGEECVPPTLAPQESGGVLPCSAGAWLKCSAKNPSASSPSGEEQLGVCVCDESKGVDIRWNADRERCADEVPHGIGGDCLDSRDCDRRKGLVCSRGSGKCVCGETAEGEDEGGRLEFVEIRETPEGGCAVNEFYSPRFPSSAKERGKRLIAEGVRLGRENDDFEAAKRHAVTHKGTRELESQGAFACEEMDENVSNEIEEGEKSAVRGACGANLSLVGCHRTARLMGLSPSSCFRELNSQHESEFWPHPAFREEKEEACAQCRHGQMCVEETLEEAVEGSISVWRCEEACERAEGEAMRKIKMKDGRCLTLEEACEEKSCTASPDMLERGKKIECRGAHRVELEELKHESQLVCAEEQGPPRTLGHGERCEEDRDCDMEAGLLCRGLTGGHESLCLCGASAVSSDRHVSFNEALKTCIEGNELGYGAACGTRGSPQCKVSAGLVCTKGRTCACKMEGDKKDPHVYSHTKNVCQPVKNLLGKGIECNSSSDCTSPLLCLSKLEKVLGLSEGSQKEREGHIGLESSGGTKRTCECPPRLGGPLRRDKKTGLETTAVQLKFDEETGGCFSRAEMDMVLSCRGCFDLSDFHALQEQTDALEAAKREKERDTQRSAREISADASADPLTALQVDQSGVMEEEEGETDVSSEGDGRRTGTLRRSRKGLSPLKAFAEDVFRRSRRWHGNERGKSTIRHRTKKAERKGRREIAGELAGVGEGDVSFLQQTQKERQMKTKTKSIVQFSGGSQTNVHAMQIKKRSSGKAKCMQGEQPGSFECVCKDAETNWMSDKRTCSTRWSDNGKGVAGERDQQRKVATEMREASAREQEEELPRSTSSVTVSDTYDAESPSALDTHFSARDPSTMIYKEVANSLKVPYRPDCIITAEFLLFQIRWPAPPPAFGLFGCRKIMSGTLMR